LRIAITRLPGFQDRTQAALAPTVGFAAREVRIEEGATIRRDGMDRALAGVGEIAARSIGPACRDQRADAIYPTATQGQRARRSAQMLPRPGMQILIRCQMTVQAVQIGRDEEAGDVIAVPRTVAAITLRALEATGLDALVVAGGVGANRELRAALGRATARVGARVWYPRIEFCTDNAAMIAVAGLLRLDPGRRESLGVQARARWPIDSLDPVGAAATARLGAHDARTTQGTGTTRDLTDAT